MRAAGFPLFKKNIDSLVAAVIGFFIIMLYTKHGGIGVSPDSIDYTSVARNIRTGNGLTEFTGNPLVDFPAFYPIFLSATMFITGKDILQFAPVLNGLMFGLVVFLSGHMMELFIQRSRYYKWILLIFILVTPALIEIFYMLWSETLFILLSMFFFLALKNYFNHHTIKALLLVSVIVAIAFVTRYAGITFIATCWMLILLDKQLTIKKKILHLLLSGIVSISLAAANLIRNSMITGTMTGERQKGVTPLSSNIEYYGSVLCDWLSFFRNHYSWAILIGMAVLIVFIAIFLWQAFQFGHYYSYENIAVAFFIVYIVFILASATISRYETLNNRLLAPAFIPFLWGLTYRVPGWLDTIEQKIIKPIAVLCCVAIATFFFINQLNADKEVYAYVGPAGIPGYTEDVWRQSPAIQFIQKDTSLFKAGNRVYSNANEVVYFYTGRKIPTVPERLHYIEVKNFFTNPRCYIIWLTTDENPDLLNLQEIGSRKKITLLHTFKDGSIYYCVNDTTAIR